MYQNVVGGVWECLKDELLEPPKSMYSTSSVKLSPKSTQSSDQSTKGQGQEEELVAHGWPAEKHPSKI